MEELSSEWSLVTKKTSSPHKEGKEKEGWRGRDRTRGPLEKFRSSSHTKVSQHPLRQSFPQSRRRRSPSFRRPFEDRKKASKWGGGNFSKGGRPPSESSENVAPAAAVEEKSGENCDSSASVESGQAAADPEIILVPAPIPEVNPWQKRNALLTAGKGPPAPGPSTSVLQEFNAANAKSKEKEFRGSTSTAGKRGKGGGTKGKENGWKTGKEAQPSSASSSNNCSSNNNNNNYLPNYHTAKEKEDKDVVTHQTTNQCSENGASSSLGGDLSCDASCSSVCGESVTQEEVVFIPAPIPEVNPWQTNKNAVSVIGQGGKSVLSPTTATANVPNPKERAHQTPPAVTSGKEGGTRNPSPPTAAAAAPTPTTANQEMKKAQLDIMEKNGLQTSTKSDGEGPKVRRGFAAITKPALPALPSAEEWPSLEVAVGAGKSVILEKKGEEEDCWLPQAPPCKDHSSESGWNSGSSSDFPGEETPSESSHSHKELQGEKPCQSENGSLASSSEDQGLDPELDGKKGKSKRQKWVKLELPIPVTPRPKSRGGKDEQAIVDATSKEEIKGGAKGNKEKEVKKEGKAQSNGSNNNSSTGPTNGVVYPARGRGRGGAHTGGRGRGRRRGGWASYYDETDGDASSYGIVTDFPAGDYTTLPPMYPMTEYLMPYNATTYYTGTPVVDDAAAAVVALIPAEPADTALLEMVKKQMEYYFSPENLLKDFFLRRKMDSNGFLPVSIIASFPRIQSMTQELEVVVQAILTSSLLELSPDLAHVRTLNDPKKWPIITSPLGNGGDKGQVGWNIDVPEFIPKTNFQGLTA